MTGTEDRQSGGPDASRHRVPAVSGLRACVIRRAAFSALLAALVLPVAWPISRGAAAIGDLPANDALTAPPVIAPRAVETQPLTPEKPGRFVPGEMVLEAHPVLTLSGNASWDEAYEKLVEAFRTLEAERARLGLTRAGDQLVVYLGSDDNGFDFEAQLPFAGATTQKPGQGVRLGASHAGRVFTFRHSGSFADMDNSYEQIANFLDERAIDIQDLYIERYRSDLVTTAPDMLEIDILVPAPEGASLIKGPVRSPLPGVTPAPEAAAPPENPAVPPGEAETAVPTQAAPKPEAAPAQVSPEPAAPAQGSPAPAKPEDTQDKAGTP